MEQQEAAEGKHTIGHTRVLPAAATGGALFQSWNHAGLLPLACSWSSPAGLDFKLLGSEPGTDPPDPSQLVL